MKKCKYCAEEIQDEAIKCRFCGEFFNKEEENIIREELININPEYTKNTQSKENKRGFKFSWFIGVIIIACLAFIFLNDNEDNVASKSKKIDELENKLFCLKDDGTTYVIEEFRSCYFNLEITKKEYLDIQKNPIKNKTIAKSKEKLSWEGVNYNKPEQSSKKVLKIWSNEIQKSIANIIDNKDKSKNNEIDSSSNDLYQIEKDKLAEIKKQTEIAMKDLEQQEKQARELEEKNRIEQEKRSIRTMRCGALIFLGGSIFDC